MECEFKFGLNVINQMLSKGLQELQCDRMDCMAYNVNLDFILQLSQKYPHVSKIKLYANSQNVYFSPTNRKEIYDLLEVKRIEIHHFSKNDCVIHAKIYRFWKNEKLLFGAIGSANFTTNSNQNFESLLYTYDPVLINKMWEDIQNTYLKYGISEKTDIPEHILSTIDSDPKINEKYLEGLWAHQKAIFTWMAKRNNMIINIPPGCGKTKIAVSYMKYLSDIEGNISTLILVPTKTLIQQWFDRLAEEKIQCFEWGTNLEGLNEYFANPEKKAIVTLYSRFYDQYKQFYSRMRIVRPNILIISDECHNLYEHLNNFYDFNIEYAKINRRIYNVGLSATIESFKKDEVERYIKIMGGEKNIYKISLPSFYSHWNNLNPRPSLKKIRYIPVKYRLSLEDMDEYKELSRHVGIQSVMKRLTNDVEYGAAIKRAMWVRNLSGGFHKLKEYLDLNIATINEGSTIIFVQTNEMAEKIREYITSHVGWDKNSSAYVYDSSRDDKYRNYALEQFRKNSGFCLISEIMLSEGFDIPKISRVILHGSRRSERDWIQKIGRAIRYDKEDPESIAEVIDIVFCYPDGNLLPLEEERYETLKSISI